MSSYTSNLLQLLHFWCDLTESSEFAYLIHWFDVAIFKYPRVVLAYHIIYLVNHMLHSMFMAG